METLGRLFTISRFVLCLLLVPSMLSATPAQDAAYQLAQGCYAIQSPGTGKYLSRTSIGTYRFDSASAANAPHFFFKPSDLGEFLLTDQDGKYLSSSVPATEIVRSDPNLSSEWEITGEEAGVNTFRFQLKNRVTLQRIKNSYWKTVSYFWGWYKTKTLETESTFKLTAQTDCRDFPEMTVNGQADRSALKGDPNEAVRGFVDSHTHVTSYEFMGGKVIHGDPFHRWGVESALADSKVIHGKDGSFDIIGNLYQHGDIGYRYDTRGWPDFPWWPNYSQLTHSGYYYKWIERSYLAGLRIMVVDLVENQVLCNVQSTINPAGWVGANSCDTMDSIRLQAKRLYEMQDYVDAQFGGPGKGFFRIVKSPGEARQVIADGKLAVVMGVEASETFNCGKLDFCSVAKIESGLTELYDLGVRSIFPAHKFDNHIGGSHVEDGFINLGQALSTGYFFKTKECDDDTRGRQFMTGVPLLRDIPVIADIMLQTGTAPEYDETIEHCNTNGLSDLGVYLVNRMIDLNMIIELDHSSTDSVTAMMDIVEARNYSGVVSSHSWMHSAKDNGLHKNAKRLIRAGGFVAPYNSDANDMNNRVGRYLDELANTEYLQGVGFGTDMAGLGGQAAPRNNVDSAPLHYPFVSEFGFVFDKQVAGNRVFDLNKDGVAHYGMVADHIEDMREQSNPRVYEAVMQSAEAYLQMWERASSNANAEFVNPL